MSEFEIQIEVISSSIKQLLRKDGIDKGLLLRIDKVEKLTYCCNNLRMSDGFKVYVTCIKSLNKDYKKGDVWHFVVPCHFNTIEDYFKDKYDIV